MTNPWQEWKNKNTEKQKQGIVSPIDFLNPDTEYATEQVSNERYQECLRCDELIPVTHQCKQCGCFMRQKTKLLHATCPMGKW